MPSINGTQGNMGAVPYPVATTFTPQETSGTTLAYPVGGDGSLSFRFEPATEPYIEGISQILDMIKATSPGHALLFDVAEMLAARDIVVTQAVSDMQAGLFLDSRGKLTWSFKRQPLERRGILLTSACGCPTTPTPTQKQACAVFELLTRLRDAHVQWEALPRQNGGETDPPTVSRRIDIDPYTLAFRSSLPAWTPERASIAKTGKLKSEVSTELAPHPADVNLVLDLARSKRLILNFDTNMRDHRQEFVQVMNAIHSTEDGQTLLASIADVCGRRCLIVKHEPALARNAVTQARDGDIVWHYSRACLGVRGLGLIDSVSMDLPTSDAMYACGAFDTLRETYKSMAMLNSRQLRGNHEELRLDIDGSLQEYFSDLLSTSTLSPADVAMPPAPASGQIPLGEVHVHSIEGALDVHYHPGAEAHHDHITYIVRALNSIESGRQLLADLRAGMRGPLHIVAVTGDRDVGGAVLQHGTPTWRFNIARMDQDPLPGTPLTVVQQWAIMAGKDLVPLRNALMESSRPIRPLTVHLADQFWNVARRDAALQPS